MQLNTDTFDFNAFLKAPDEDYKLESPSRFRQQVVDRFYGETRDAGATMPWPKTHKYIKFRPAEVTIWAGINGHGRSMVTSHVALDLAWQGEVVCIMSMEMLPEATLGRMVRQASGRDTPSIRFIDRFLSWSDNRIVIFDHQGTVTAKLIIGSIRYAAAKYGVTQFFVDSLMKCSKGEDDYNGQKDFVDELTAAARDLRVHIHLVHHVKKLENEFVIPGKFDAKGSGAITDQVDNYMVVWRNKKKEVILRANPTDPKAMSDYDAVLKVDKQRHGTGWEGQFGLFFDVGAQSYKEDMAMGVMRYEMPEEDVLPPLDTSPPTEGSWDSPVPIVAAQPAVTADPDAW